MAGEPTGIPRCLASGDGGCAQLLDMRRFVDCVCDGRHRVLGDGGSARHGVDFGGVVVRGAFCSKRILGSWGEGDGSAKLGEYGAWDYSTRVSSHVDWIDCVLGPQDSGDTGQADESTGSASNVECPQRKCGCSTTGGANNLWASVPVMLLGLLRRRP